MTAAVLAHAGQDGGGSGVPAALVLLFVAALVLLLASPVRHRR